MYEPWNHKIGDQEIKKCPGDYIGCEICKNVSKYLDIKLGLVKVCMEDKKDEYSRIVWWDR